VHADADASWLVACACADFGLISLFCCVAAMYFGSISTPPPTPEQLDGLTYTSAMAGITAAETARNEAAKMQPNAEQETAAAVPGTESAWERAVKMAGENFDDLNKYGSVLVVLCLSIMLVSFA
jgi:hypothetical protein